MPDLTRNICPMICALSLLLTGCSTSSPLEEALRDRVTDLELHRTGDEHFVSTRDGNLVTSTVFSSEERQVQLEDFINTYKSDFGITSTDTLQFVRHDTEFDFEFAEHVLTGLPLVQSINGLRILDREQLGVFDLESGALKAVRIRVADPTSLALVTVPERRDNIQSLAARFLEARNIVCTEIRISDEPAYSIAAGLAGFEVRCTSRPNSHYVLKVRLLVSTDTDTVALLAREERDVPP